MCKSAEAGPVATLAPVSEESSAKIPIPETYCTD